jgi:hypothetical protein
MRDPKHPSPEATIERLRRSGWSCKVAGFTTSDGRIFSRVEGSKGTNRIRVQGQTAREAWHKRLR